MDYFVAPHSRVALNRGAAFYESSDTTEKARLPTFLRDKFREEKSRFRPIFRGQINLTLPERYVNLAFRRG